MTKIAREDALRYHSEGKPGKIEVVPTKLTAVKAIAGVTKLPVSKEVKEAYKLTELAFGRDVPCRHCEMHLWAYHGSDIFP